MKKTQLFLCTCLSLCLVSLNSCKKVDELTTFDLAYSAKVTVPSNAVINLPFDLFTPDVTTNSESEFATKGTAKDYIDKINLTSLAMKITSPSTQRFVFVKSIEISISASGLSDIKIAQKLDVPDNIGTDLSLDILENNIAEYIKKDKFKLNVKVITDKSITSDVKIDINSNFRVKAKLL